MKEKKKYYAVINNMKKTKNIYNNWEECKKNVYGFKGVIFKSFSTIKEAKNFLNLDLYLIKSNTKKLIFKTEIAIYVDGSYDVNSHKYSYGMVVVNTNKNINIYEEYGVGFNKIAAELRNIAGEMRGAMRAVQYAKNNNINFFSLCYDYIGIEKWANGKWKRKNIFTEAYYKYMQKNLLFQKIIFIKIKSHSNDYWNNFVDGLAKKALKL